MWEERERDFFNERGRKIQAEKIQRLSYLLMSIVVIGCNPQAKLSSMIVSFITKKKIAAFAASLSLIEFVIFFGESCIALCG